MGLLDRLLTELYTGPVGNFILSGGKIYGCLDHWGFR